jgi:hypothetical protein
MTWDARDTIALVELIFYIPFLFLSVFVCSRHGFSRSSGWLYIIILCIVRIIGGILQFVSHNDHSTGLLEATLVLDSVGITPLLLATLGLLSRFVDFVNAHSKTTLTSRHFRLVQVVLFVGLILAVVGGTSMNVDANGTYQVPGTSQAGVILYIVAFAGLILMFLLSVPQASAVPTKERRVPLAVALALPFLSVRLLYSVLSVFSHNHIFSVATGSSTVRLGMAVIEEFVVVAVYVMLGFFVDKLDASTKGPIASRPWSNKKGPSLPFSPRSENTARQVRDDVTIDPEAQHLRNYSPPFSPPPNPQVAGVSR